MKTTTAFLFSSLLAPAAAFAPSFVSKNAASTRLFAEEETTEEVEAAEWKGAQAISGLTADVGKVFQLEDIAKILPHRYPFALVDKIIEYEPGQVCVFTITLVKCKKAFFDILFNFQKKYPLIHHVTLISSDKIACGWCQMCNQQRAPLHRTFP